MATGDQADMLRRLKATLPRGWFPGTAPLLDGVLSGTAAMWEWAYGLLAYVRLQTRIATATDVWLDTIATDFFGIGVRRFVSEGDPAFSLRIRANLLPERATRAALISVLTTLTGRAPIIFEPSNTGDAGSYIAGGSFAWGGMAYGNAGGWGSLALPFQAFVIAYRPSSGGVSGVGGYWSGSGWGGGGYGVGAIEYVSASMIAGQVTDEAIYQAIAAAIPAGSIAWTQISA